MSEDRYTKPALTVGQLADLLHPLSQNNSTFSNPISTSRRMISVLNWQTWSSLCKIELIYTFTKILLRMWQWSSSLTPEYLQPFCASPQFFEVRDSELKLTSN